MVASVIGHSALDIGYSKNISASSLTVKQYKPDASLTIGHSLLGLGYLKNDVREIEIDGSNQVYVLNVNGRNQSDLLWKYPSLVVDGFSNWSQLPLSGPTSPIKIDDPIGLCVSDKHRMVFIGSGQVNPNDPLATKVYGFSSTQLQQIMCEIKISGMQQVCDITEDPATGDLSMLGFSKDEERWNRNTLMELEESFFRPSIVRIDSDKIAAAEPREPLFVPAKPIEGGPGHPMDLPLSLVWTGRQ